MSKYSISKSGISFLISAATLEGGIGSVGIPVASSENTKQLKHKQPKTGINEYIVVHLAITKELFKILMLMRIIYVLQIISMYVFYITTTPRRRANKNLETSFYCSQACFTHWNSGFHANIFT